MLDVVATCISSYRDNSFAGTTYFTHGRVGVAAGKLVITRVVEPRIRGIGPGVYGGPFAALSREPYVVVVLQRFQYDIEGPVPFVIVGVGCCANSYFAERA